MLNVQIVFNSTYLLEFVNIVAVRLGGFSGFSARTLLLLQICSIVRGFHRKSCPRPFTKLLLESSVQQNPITCLPFQLFVQVQHILFIQPALIIGGGASPV